MYDLIIKNGKILDGTGNPYYRADIAVKDGKIARIGKHIEDGCRIIDATGLTVTPGFIDSHSHADRDVLAYPHLVETSEQGITTVIAGQCGSSDPVAQQFRLVHRHAARFQPRLARRSRHIAQSRYGLRKPRPHRKGTGTDETTVDRGDGTRRKRYFIRSHLCPGCHADTQELVELATIVARYHGVAAIHLRNEGDTLVEAVQEFISIVRASGVRGVLSHHKATRQKKLGQSQNHSATTG